MACVSHTAGDPEFVGLDEVAFELRPSFVVVGESVSLKYLVHHLCKCLRDLVLFGEDKAVFETVD